MNQTYKIEGFVETKEAKQNFSWLNPWKRVYMMLNNETQELQMFSNMVFRINISIKSIIYMIFKI